LDTFAEEKTQTTLQNPLTVRVRNIYSSSLRKMQKENNATLSIGNYSLFSQMPLGKGATGTVYKG
jgi:hypothetical protein